MFQKINMNNKKSLGTRDSFIGNYDAYIKNAQIALSELKFSDRNSYRKAEELMNSDNKKDQIKGSDMFFAMRNQANITKNNALDTNATSVSNLGVALPRLSVGIVGMFYDETVGQYLVQNQFLDSPKGYVIVEKPVFSNYDPNTNNIAGVTAPNMDLFGQGDHTTYSSAIQKQVVTGTNATITAQFPKFPIRPNTLSIKVDGVKVNAFDRGIPSDESSVISGDAIDATGTNSINYKTGAVSFKLATAPATNVEIEVVYYYDNANATIPAPDQRVREVELNLDTIPIECKSHPLALKLSIEAALTAKSIGLNLEARLKEMTLQKLLIEKDNQIIKAIVDSAFDGGTAMDFSIRASDAQGVAGVFAHDQYKGFELRIDRAETLIKSNNNKRGGVSYVIVSDLGREVVTQCPSFKADPSYSKPHVGPYRLGTLRDGAVDVIYVTVDQNDPNRIMNNYDYFVGFRGFVFGDSNVIVGTYTDVFATEPLTTSNLFLHQGFLSIYDIVNNSKSKYIVRGKILN